MKSTRWPMIGLVGLISFVSCSSNPGNSSPQISLNASPSQIVIGQNVLLVANVPGNPNATVNWAVNGIPNGNSTVGMILADVSGGPTPTHALIARYAAPAAVPSPPTVIISAALQSDATNRASAAVTVGPDVTISPGLTAVPTYGTQQFSATVAGELSNTAVTWKISCATGGSACGVISQTGFYKAPNSVPTVASNSGVVTQGVTLTATSQADPLFSGMAAIIIVPPNQAVQALPIQLGTSGSNANDFCIANGGEGCSAGTLGSLLERGGVQYILTNWHIAAGTDGGVIGDALVQPGLLDTECGFLGHNTPVANVSQLSNPQTETGKKVDAAIAQAVGGAVDPTGTIEQLGSSVANGAPGSGPPAGGSGTAAYVTEGVAMSGRSTGLTCATVQAIETSVNVTYFTSPCSTTTFTVSYSGQVVVTGTGFSAGGDSGSLIVDANTAEPVALFFAGNTDTSLGNPVSDVLAALKDSSGNAPVFVGGPEHAVAACSIPAPTASARPTVRLSLADIQSAIAIKEKHVSQLMGDPAVQGVGVGASQDAANGPALVVYVLKNAAHTAIPATIEGLPVRIIETTGFRAGNGGWRCLFATVLPTIELILVTMIPVR
jgi:hypothetical protein